ncbi:MAG: DUF2914 domain-containing protein [Myxococcota bacterium]
MTSTNTMSMNRFANLRLLVAPLAMAAIALSACGGEPSADPNARRLDRFAERLAVLEAEVEAVAEAPQRESDARPEEQPGAVTPEVIRPRVDVVTPQKPQKATRPQKATHPRRVEKLPPSRLTVVDSTIALDVIKRTPLGSGDTFSPEDEVLWAWVRVKNSGEHKRTITMVWKHEGKVRSNVTLDVGVSSGWRTWSKKSITKRDQGFWTVEVLSPEGELLDTLKFEVEAEHDGDDFKVEADRDGDEMALVNDFAEGCAH